ncbi:galactose-specific lectin nattectin-like [Genypterus blacodes]|uniref:galactose-specific lectin nattectin-like n=1 Tax=Genypterus blacodes TaxID=154954 RepID=UPI003F75C651
MASYALLVFLLCFTSGLSCKDKDEEKKPPAGFCPSGWSLFGTRCFNYFGIGKIWVDAELACQAIGGNLASVHSAGEDAFLRNLIFNKSGSHRRTWIGGSDAVKEGVWLWSDGSKFVFKRWLPGQPGNTGGKEHCMEMNIGNKWNDVQCIVAYPFICAKDV